MNFIQHYRTIFALFLMYRYRSVVKLVMTRDFESRIAGSSPAAPFEPGSKSMADGRFWVPEAGGSSPLFPNLTF